jgi:hypothetical protein
LLGENQGGPSLDAGPGLMAATGDQPGGLALAARLAARAGWNGAEGRRLRLPRLEQLVMAAGMAALAILVALPLFMLFVSSIWGEDRPTYLHYPDPITERNNYQPFPKTMNMGGWTPL